MYNQSKQLLNICIKLYKICGNLLLQMSYVELSDELHCQNVSVVQVYRHLQ
jgi:hypothetical protein